MRLAKAPGRTSSIRLLVRFTESSFGCVAKEPGWSFSEIGEGEEGGLVDDNGTGRITDYGLEEDFRRESSSVRLSWPSSALGCIIAWRCMQ